jgi:hypothetical protein
MQVLIALGEPDADPERLQRLTEGVRAELLELDVDNVETVRAGEAPPGARAIDMAAVGALLVSLGGSTEALTQMVNAVRAWVGRGGGAARSVEMTVGDKTLRIANASVDQQDRLIEEFVRIVREE